MTGTTMVPDRDDRYDSAVPIPSYEEAVAGTSRRAFEAQWHPDDGHHDQQIAEGQSLLGTSRSAASTAAGSDARRRHGYHPPTAETDDEDDGLCGAEFDSESEDETDQVRREMQEMEILDAEHDDRHDWSSRNLSSLWGKRIGFSLSLPKWTRRWRLPRFQMRLGERAGRGDGGSGSGLNSTSSSAGDDAPEAQTERWWRRWHKRLAVPPFSGAAALLVLGRTLAVLLVLGLLYVLFMSDLFTNMARRMGTQMFDPESVRAHVQTMIDPNRIREKMDQFTSYAHLAGTAGDYRLAAGIKNDFVEYGLEKVRVDEYYVYLNYPNANGRSVEILGSENKPIWSAKLEEPDVGGETAGHETYVFHAHSKSGEAEGPLIYANYGSRDDFKFFEEHGIDTRGAIALVRAGGPEADLGPKVLAAQLAGFSGCLIYSDPADDGFIKGPAAPNGRWMPADAVRRGSVALSGQVIGDPLTPGWESKKTIPRLNVTDSPALVKIPSLPLGWIDAQPLLQRIKGCGERAPKNWVGGVPEVDEWWVGNTSSPIVRLRNHQDEVEKQAIWNVCGRIDGIEQPEKSVIIGNRRDSFAFGASGPHSGTAVFLEVVRIFGDLLSRGWRPLRSIEFMSWDGGEYNMIGSTEFVEEYTETLRRNGLAYINLDQAITGNEFHASGSPVFRKLLLQVLNRVADPIQNVTIRQLFEARHGDLEAIGAGSDYVAFQDIAGTSSLDIRFQGDGFPYRTSFDNFQWMDRVGDPGFVYHKVLGQILALLIVELADRPVLPLDLPTYADRISHWVDDLRHWAKNSPGGGKAEPVDLSPLRAAASELVASVREFEKWQVSWESSVVAASGWEPSSLGRRRDEYNEHMAWFETDLLDRDEGGGIPNRTQFKHVIFGPQLWSPHEVSLFPAVRHILEEDDSELAKTMVERIAKIMKTAASNLLHSS
ncbi:hypothetical protein VTK73DRAFT_2032 [Phialemonium thermophilum]|uniref:N-acetylated-alpha-linked acidic dipeptidase n=1 Tax=Phialemonium thermophilum TaxID=223376 RepID=A0ABR3X6M2_9PEZI